MLLKFFKFILLNKSLKGYSLSNSLFPIKFSNSNLLFDIFNKQSEQIFLGLLINLYNLTKSNIL